MPPTACSPGCSVSVCAAGRVISRRSRRGRDGLELRPRRRSLQRKTNMDFNFTEDQLAIQAMARDFAQKRIAPSAAEFDAKGEFPLDNIREMGQLGLMGIEVPVEYGGAGMDSISYVLAMIEIAAADCAHSTIMSVNNTLYCNGLLKFAPQEQKLKYLKPIESGRAIRAFCPTEPQP